MRTPEKELTQYISELDRKFQQGNTTEHSYRPALQTLLESMTSGLSITNEPKRIDCGAPDFILTRGNVPVGYIEAKDILTGIHDKADKGQFDRYKRSLDNLIITDYINFELFISGALVQSAAIGTVTGQGIKADKSRFDAFAGLVETFADFQGKTVTSPEVLAKLMAAKAKLLAATIGDALKKKLEGEGSLAKQLEGFRAVLLHDLQEKTFADMYAQTVAYGMFAACLNDASPGKEKFTRQKAANLIPQSNPFLREFFHHIAGWDLDVRICWVVDALADAFNCVSVEDILKEFGKAGQDPYIHFYETFLAEYDPGLRENRGVYYTPLPAVRFIVQAVDDILQHDFSLPQGLADSSRVTQTIINPDGTPDEIQSHKVHILEPALGTGTFLSATIDKIYERFAAQKGLWPSYCKEHLIPRLNGFEILMAPYAMAHFKLHMKLKETGYGCTERLRVFLTNSLEQPDASIQDLPFAPWLAAEAREAGRVKQNVPVMVVMGNPPYSGESANKGCLEDLMGDYKKEPGGGALRERNSKWLNDDYAKFIRYGQSLIERNREGILAYINNHGFLDNPTFRGMRWELLRAFDKIYVLDLHGNAKKKETAPEGGKDDNIFDIQQGVSVNIFIKTGGKKDGELAHVEHYDLYGKREAKQRFLMENTLATVGWQKLTPQAPFYFFVKKDLGNSAEYEKGFSVHELFPVNSAGIVTANDSVFIGDNKRTLTEKVKTVSREPQEKIMYPINYRPFDCRYIYYDVKRIERAREKVMQHFLKGKNVGLITVSRQPMQNKVSYYFITDKIISNGFIRSDSVSIDAVFPLYLYDQDNYNDPSTNRRPNLDIRIADAIAHKIGLPFVNEKEATADTSGGKNFAPIDLLDYIYAYLHCTAYREKYREFLKINFPRVPYPESAGQFFTLAALGADLRKIHLLEGILPSPELALFPEVGCNDIDKLEYRGGKVWINSTQYFDRVPQESWEFFIGGYQPAQKWLKDRKGQTLDYDQIQHYQKIITALHLTREIQAHIDESLGSRST